MTIVEAGKIRELEAAVERMQDRADEAKEDLKAAMDAVGAAGLNKAAFKSALKLKKLKPVDLKSWLNTFDAVRDAIGLDAQMDLEDAIEAMAAPAGEDDSVTMTVGGHTVDLTDAGRAIRKARGRSRELN